jgi:hypothetical protein
MADQLTLDEITIMGVTQEELFGYIRRSSSGKEWPATIVKGAVEYSFDVTYELPVEMRTYIQAARYVRK